MLSDTSFQRVTTTWGICEGLWSGQIRIKKISWSSRLWPRWNSTTIWKCDNELKQGYFTGNLGDTSTRNSSTATTAGQIWAREMIGRPQKYIYASSCWWIQALQDSDRIRPFLDTFRSALTSSSIFGDGHCLYCVRGSIRAFEGGSGTRGGFATW